MKILVIFTGGTIGSAVSEGYISPDSKCPYKLIESYKCQEISQKWDVDFETYTPYTLLSEDLTGEYLARLGTCVKENLHKEYDGIIVAHGTDTLQYSAAMVGYVTGNSSIPVVFVSSNYVLEDKRANGLCNFICAVEFIKEKRGEGTFISYRNLDGITYMHRAFAVLPHLPYSDEVFSIGNQYYGKYMTQAWQKEENQISQDKLWQFEKNAEYHLKDTCKPVEKLPAKWKSGILRIFPYPGMEYPRIEPFVRAVLLDTYHSGTLCTAAPDMERFFEEAERRGIPVYITGANTETDYASFQKFESKNVHVLRNLSPVAAYVKLWLALEEDKNDLAQSMKSL